MAITSLKRSALTGITKYDSMLAGNEAFLPGGFESIATVTAAGGEEALTFTNIPQNYVALQIRGIARRHVSTTSPMDMQISFNVVGPDYRDHGLVGDGSAASAYGAATNGYGIRVSNAIPGDSVTAGVFNASVIDIHDYASSTRNKTVRALAGVAGNTSSTNFRVEITSGLYISLNPVTSLTLYVSTGFKAGSTFALYGIRGA